MEKMELVETLKSMEPGTRVELNSELGEAIINHGEYDHQSCYYREDSICTHSMLPVSFGKDGALIFSVCKKYTKGDFEDEYFVKK